MSSAASCDASTVGGIFSSTRASLLSNHSNTMVVSIVVGSSTTDNTLDSFMAGVMTPAPTPSSSAAAAVRLAPIRQPVVVDVPSPSPFHFAHLLTIKMSADNFLYWRAQVLPLLRSHNLLGYIDGSLSCPSSTVVATTTAGAQHMVPNQAYTTWVQQDQAIRSAIQSSLTEGVAGMTLFAATSQDA
jgi:hypothetical protein